jgi:hypothetical protein
VRGETGSRPIGGNDRAQVFARRPYRHAPWIHGPEEHEDRRQEWAAPTESTFSAQGRRLQCPRPASQSGGSKQHSSKSSGSGRQADSGWKTPTALYGMRLRSGKCRASAAPVIRPPLRPGIAPTRAARTWCAGQAIARSQPAPPRPQAQEGAPAGHEAPAPGQPVLHRVCIQCNNMFRVTCEF